MGGIDLNRAIDNRAWQATVVATFVLIFWNLLRDGIALPQDDPSRIPVRAWINADRGKVYLIELTTYYGEPVNDFVTTSHYFVEFLRAGASTLETAPLDGPAINFDQLKDEIKAKGTPTRVAWDDRMVDAKSLPVEVRYLAASVFRFDLPRFRLLKGARKWGAVGGVSMMALIFGVPLGAGLATLFAFLVPAFLGVADESVNRTRLQRGS
jgi:hypothetical protein